MPACSAYGCTNRPGRKKGISFHRFPKESVLRAAWIVACRRKNWLPSSVSVLCNEHFSEDLIDRTSFANVRLRRNAIPTIFKGLSELSNCEKNSGKHKSLKKQLIFTPITTVFRDEETQSSNNRITETVKECDVVETAVCLNSAKNKSSIEYILPEPIPEIYKSAKKCLTSTVTTTFFTNEIIHSSDKSILESPTKCDEIQSTDLNFPINESSVENMPPVQILKKRKFPEKHEVSTVTMAFSNNEVFELSDDSMSEDSTECGVMEPIVSLNSTVNESNVNIPVRESDSELYPNQDIETIYLKRKLEKANNLISNYRKKFKVLQQQNRRWKKQLEETKRILNILQKANKLVFL